MEQESESKTRGTAEQGARATATDPRTGVRVVGTVTGDGAGERVEIDPLGPAYHPGRFEAGASDVRILGRPGEEPDDDEIRARKEWDLTCMVMLGAHENLPDDRLEMVTGAINDGHL